jgi:predicted DNA-binding protein with PD1-like motif
MICIKAHGGSRTWMVSFRMGDYVIEELRKLFKAEGVDAALIVGGIGSLDICRLHTIAGTTLPIQEHHYTLRGPIEVGSLQGSVAGGEPHLHVVVDDVANHKQYVAHLEEGSRCLFRVELGVIVLDGVKTTRKRDAATGLVDIVEAEG